MKYLLSPIISLCICMSCTVDYRQDLSDNYESKQLQIKELCEYVNEITKSGNCFEIEFESDRRIAYFYASIRGVDSITGIVSHTTVFADSNYNEGGNESNRNLDIESPYVDVYLAKLGWTRNDLTVLKQKLDDANCISVESKYPFTYSIKGDRLSIGYKRTGLGMYSYVVFDEVLSDSLIHLYNDSCKYIYYKDNIVFEYKGGVVGKQCF